MNAKYNTILSLLEKKLSQKLKVGTIECYGGVYSKYNIFARTNNTLMENHHLYFLFLSKVKKRVFTFLDH